MTTELTTESPREHQGSQRVLVAVRHATMRRLTVELIRYEHQGWTALAPRDGELLADALRRLQPDVLVVDDGDFPACCLAAIAAFPPSRVVVVGTEPDRAYEAAALRAGAGAWVPRERVGETLGAVLRIVLACGQAPDPPAAVDQGLVATAGPAVS